MRIHESHEAQSVLVIGAAGCVAYIAESVRHDHARYRRVFRRVDPRHESIVHPHSEPNPAAEPLTIVATKDSHPPQGETELTTSAIRSYTHSRPDRPRHRARAVPVRQ
jgi:hypothetical protein